MNPPDLVKVVMAIFLAIGIVLLGLCTILTLKTSAFLADAIATEGSVIDQPWQPIVRFAGPDGPVEFTTTVSSEPPSYQLGQSVPVLYRPSDPQNARINSFIELWFGTAVTGLLGSIFTLISTGILLYQWRHRALKHQLQVSGTPIVTDFQRVAVDTSCTTNGCNPFVIFTQWQNPATSQIDVFKSEALWFDPSDYVSPGKKITVLVDPANPEHYSVDLSFLPQQND